MGGNERNLAEWQGIYQSSCQGPGRIIHIESVRTRRCLLFPKSDNVYNKILVRTNPFSRGPSAGLRILLGAHVLHQAHPCSYKFCSRFAALRTPEPQATFHTYCLVKSPIQRCHRYTRVKKSIPCRC